MGSLGLEYDRTSGWPAVSRRAGALKVVMPPLWRLTMLPTPPYQFAGIRGGLGQTCWR